jgi:hypothetical protein
MSSKAFYLFIFITSSVLISGCNEDESASLQLLQAFVGTREISLDGQQAMDVPTDRSISLIFSAPLNPDGLMNAIQLNKGQHPVDVNLILSQPNTILIHPVGALENGATYSIEISDRLKSTSGAQFNLTRLQFTTVLGMLKIDAVDVSGVLVNDVNRTLDVPLDLNLTFTFNTAVDPNEFKKALTITGVDLSDVTVVGSDEDHTITITYPSLLKDFTKYTLSIGESLESSKGERFDGYSLTFYTGESAVLKFPAISDDQLLTLVQQQTFKYFWDFGHPVSGMARERNTSGDIVTTGGTGFSLMAMIVGIERGFITREEGIQRIKKIVDFLKLADRFHGAWPHWMNGATGKVVPFSANDDGGDLVETSFLIQGLLTVRQYLDASVTEESSVIDSINELWNSVEWSWYTKGEQVLYWHWSPRVQWAMNHQIRGHNETLITYVLAASSQTYPVETSVYHSGYARSGAIKSGKTFYNHTLPLGEDFGGPLFFAHYSFLGLDPRKLSDTYANYWQQNVNHTLINRAYAIANPKKYAGYSDRSWGLTASDNHTGYAAHSPTNDMGVITPSAALSSFPYTPAESMEALKFFYYTVGDRLWGPYGFYDAFNFTQGWVADSYLAIDQGPIIIMIENYRTALLWNLFMSAPEVQQGLQKLSFTY